MILYVNLILLQQGLSTFSVIDSTLPIQTKRLVQKFWVEFITI